MQRGNAMTIGEWLRRAVGILKSSGCPDPRIDAYWLVENTLKITRTQLHFQSGLMLEDAQLERLNQLLSQRSTGIPVQYLLHSAYFMGMEFYVDDRVLIPRQDTETLVESAVDALRGLHEPRLLDLCTGSGAIGLSIKALMPAVRVTLADISADALDVARINARALNVDVDIRQGDLFSAVASERFDFILSNPPYIPRKDLGMLQQEVLHEPELALNGGDDGLDFYRRIAEAANKHLNPGGFLFLEVGIGEAAAVLDMVTKQLPCIHSGIQNDLNSIPRVVWARSG